MHWSSEHGIRDLTARAQCLHALVFRTWHQGSHSARSVHADQSGPLQGCTQRIMPNKAEPLDEVARNAIWTEHCKREGRALGMNTEFGGIRSPKKSAGSHCMCPAVGTVFVRTRTYMREVLCSSCPACPDLQMADASCASVCTSAALGALVHLPPPHKCTLLQW